MRVFVTARVGAGSAIVLRNAALTLKLELEVRDESSSRSLLHRDRRSVGALCGDSGPQSRENAPRGVRNNASAREATSRKIASAVAIDSPQARRHAIDLSLGRGAENLENVRGVLSQLIEAREYGSLEKARVATTRIVGIVAAVRVTATDVAGCARELSGASAHLSSTAQEPQPSQETSERRLRVAASNPARLPTRGNGRKS